VLLYSSVGLVQLVTTSNASGRSGDCVPLPVEVISGVIRRSHRILYLITPAFAEKRKERSAAEGRINVSGGSQGIRCLMILPTQASKNVGSFATVTKKILPLNISYVGRFSFQREKGPPQSTLLHRNEEHRNQNQHVNR
jgi:hypothetical protein